MSHTLLLLAQRSNWSRMGDRFSGAHAKFDVGELITIALLCVGAVALIWGLHWLAKRQEGWLSRPNPRRLFRELCKAHQLKRHDRTLLSQLAEATDVGQPSELFLRPDLFEADGLPGELQNWATDLERIARTLFAESTVADKKAESQSQDAQQQREQSSSDLEPVAN